MKYLLFVFLTITSVSSCEDLEVVKATSQPWAGGIPSSPGGINYAVVVVALKSSDKLTIDQLWVKKELHKVSVLRMLPGELSSTFDKNDTIHIKATKINGRDMTSARPEGFSEEWVLGYRINGERAYKGIAKVVPLKSISNP